MRITLLTVGKTDVKWVKEGLDLYVSRLVHYIQFSVNEIPELKNVSALRRNFLLLSFSQRYLLLENNSIFTRRFKEALTFLHMPSISWEDSSISPKRTKFRLCEIILNGRVIGNTPILLKHYYLVII